MSLMNDRANGNSAKKNEIKLNKAARNILFYADEKKGKK